MRETIINDTKVRAAVWLHKFSGQSHRPHNHDELEVNLVTQGYATYLVDDQVFELFEGTLIWLYPEQTHVLFGQSKDFEMLILVIRPEELQNICQSSDTIHLLQARPTNPFCKRLAPPSARIHVEFCHRLLLLKDARDLLNAGLAYAVLLLWKAFQDADRILPINRLSPIVQKAAQTISEDLDYESLALMAKRLGVSPTRLGVIFRKQIGITMVEFKNQHRINRSLTMMSAEPERTLLSIALDCGFGSYTQFYRVFKSLLGVGPEQFRIRELD